MGFGHGREPKFSIDWFQTDEFSEIALNSKSLEHLVDPDGNGWLLQEITTRLPGRVAGDTAFASASDLSQALRRAAAAHGKHESLTGQADPNWPGWYAQYMVCEQSGEELPQ